MKLVPKSAAVLAPLLLALAACGGGEDADDAAAGTGADTTEAAVAGETATPAAGETPAPAATPSEAPSPAPTPSASRSASAPLAVTEPASFAQCKACHSVEPGKNGIGPSLAGIFGDRAAIVPGFEFSDAMKNSGLTWNQATLDRYLTDPRGVVPGTKMAFGGVKDAAKRQEIINYLKTI
jgi:cytochrome c2